MVETLINDFVPRGNFAGHVDSAFQTWERSFKFDGGRPGLHFQTFKSCNRSDGKSRSAMKSKYIGQNEVDEKREFSG